MSTAVTLGRWDGELRPGTVRAALGVESVWVEVPRHADRQNQSVCFFCCRRSPKVLWFKGNVAVTTRAPLLELWEGRESELLSACRLRPTEPKPV